MQSSKYKPLLREYARLAPRYDTRWKFYVQVSVAETVRRLDARPGDRILDVGCGTGAFLKAASERVPDAKLTGVDPSPEMLEIAKGNLGTVADLKQAWAETLPFDDAVFDLVVSTSVFHFIRRPVVALGEMHRVLRPSGRIIMTDWCDDYLTCRVCDLCLRLLSRSHFRIYSLGECRRLLEQSDFRAVDVERYKINWFWGLMTAKGTKDTAQTRQPG